jgi:hypothetical protein
MKQLTQVTETTDDETFVDEYCDDSFQKRMDELQLRQKFGLKKQHPHSNRSRLIQDNTSFIYPSIKHAALLLKVRPSAISNALKRGSKCKNLNFTYVIEKETQNETAEI